MFLPYVSVGKAYGLFCTAGSRTHIVKLINSFFVRQCLTYFRAQGALPQYSFACEQAPTIIYLQSVSVMSAA